MIRSSTERTRDDVACVMSIVVAVDGSELSTRAVSAGLALLGDASDAVVVTVTEAGDPMEVTGTGIAGGTMSAEEFDEREDAVAAEGRRIVGEAAAALGFTDAETRVVSGSPGPTLCRLASELSACAIVIGSRVMEGSSGPCWARCRTTSCAMRPVPSWSPARSASRRGRHLGGCTLGARGDSSTRLAAPDRSRMLPGIPAARPLDTLRRTARARRPRDRRCRIGRRCGLQTSRNRR